MNTHKKRWVLGSARTIKNCGLGRQFGEVGTNICQNIQTAKSPRTSKHAGAFWYLASDTSYERANGVNTGSLFFWLVTKRYTDLPIIPTSTTM